MRTVFKYPLCPAGLGTAGAIVRMPEGALVLSAQLQHGTLCLWALVDPDPEAPGQDRMFAAVGTGLPIIEPLGTYIGTAQTENGWLVWHVFEVAPPNAGSGA